MTGLERYRTFLCGSLIALLVSAAAAPLAWSDEAAGQRASASASELQAAIDAIKRRVAAQQEARDTTGASELGAELRSARQAIAELNESLVRLRTERDAAQAKLAEAEAWRAAVDADLAARQERSAALETGLADAKAGEAAAREALAAERAASQERIAELEREISQERSTRVAVTAELEAARDTASEGEAALAAVQAARDALESELAAAEERLGAADAARLAAQEQLAAAEASRQERDQQLAALEAANNTAAATIVELEQEVAALHEVANSSVREVEAMGETLLATLAENEELTTALAEARSRREIVERELVAVRRDLDAQAVAAVQEDSLAMPPRLVPIDWLPAPLVASDVLAEERDAERASVGTESGAAEGLPVAALQPDQAAARYLGQLDAVDTGDGWWMTVPEGLVFAPGSDVLAEGAAPAVGQLAALLGYFNEAPVRIVGHTDSLGDAERNRQLSRDRAAAVGRLLVEAHGIEAERLAIEGYGDERPIASNDTDEGRQANRRVEIYIRR